MANGIGDIFKPVTDVVSSGGGNGGAGAVAGGSGIIWFVGLFVGIILMSIAGAFLYFFWIEKRRWNLITRVHYENPSINGVSFGHPIPTRRLRFKDGRVVYLYKRPIQGYTISPELLTWTRPREHDVIVTQDKKLFCIEGIENIDIKRKKLNVDISYPDIEMDRQDLQHHIDSKKFDDPNEKLKMIAKVSIWIFALTTVIVLAVLGGKYYIEGKEIDAKEARTNLQVAEKQIEVMESITTFTKVLDEMLPELQAYKNNENVKSVENFINNSKTGE